LRNKTRKRAPIGCLLPDYKVTFDQNNSIR
jgi:hypothetical protein